MMRDHVQPIHYDPATVKQLTREVCSFHPRILFKIYNLLTIFNNINICMCVCIYIY